MFPAKTSVDDPRLDPLWRAATDFDRKNYGFSPLPTTGTVGWEKAHGSRYDAVLHIGGDTYRTIAFVEATDGYRWVGEQESFYGPDVFDTVDGEQRERVTLTYETVSVSGVQLNELNIRYNGEDARLAWPKNLTLAEVRPVLVEWGYYSKSN